MPTSPAPARPTWWPRFSSSVRSTALTARLGSVLGIAFAVCFLTGLLSALQYQPLTWFPWPASPPWLYRVTQGVHVATGTACLPLIMIKLWSVYPNLFRFPPLRSLVHALERGSIAVLVAASLVQLVTGFFNTLNWYPFGWDFVLVHHYLAYVVVGALLLHVGIKLPDIVYGLRARLADADVLTEIPWDENPVSHSNAGDVPPPATPGISRRGVLAASGIGVGIVVATSIGQTVTPLEPIGLLAVRRWRQGPQGVPVNRTAEEAGITTTATAADWVLQVDGPRPYVITLDDLARASLVEDRLPINCVEGWSVGATWRGLSLLELVVRAGGGPDSSVRVASLERAGLFNASVIGGPQLGRALLATHLNGERLDLDHGYPIRLIAPNRAGVLNTKWLARVEVLS
jgi:hypothetical protein